jgi:C_GCAxxG_C_C family probable redox protein
MNEKMATETAQEAVKLFDSGYNCAEAVLLALSEKFSTETPLIPRIATGFGGGIGRSGNVCGALSGAIMAIGLRIGCDKAEEKEKRYTAYNTALQMIKEFEKEFGSINCKTLTQCDLSTQEGREKFNEQNTRKEICPKFVGWCADYITKRLS